MLPDTETSNIYEQIPKNTCEKAPHPAALVLPFQELLEHTGPSKSLLHLLATGQMHSDARALDRPGPLEKEPRAPLGLGRVLARRVAAAQVHQADFLAVHQQEAIVQRGARDQLTESPMQHRNAPAEQTTQLVLVLSLVCDIVWVVFDDEEDRGTVRRERNLVL